MSLTTSAYFLECVMNFLEIAGKLDLVYLQNSWFYRMLIYANNEA